MKPYFRVSLFLLALTLTASSLNDPPEKDAITQANTLVRAGHMQEAESLLQSASDANPHSVLLHEALGELFFGQRKFEDAVRELTLALQIDPDSWHYSMLLASALINWTHFVVAADFLKAVEPRFGQYPEFHYYLGVAYLNMGSTDEAQTEFKQTIRLSPDFDRAQFLLAKCLLSQGQDGEALTLYRKLVKQRPGNAFYWVALAETLGKLGNNDTEALRAGRRAVALAPDNPQALFALATILSRRGDFTSACPLLEKLTRLDPNAIAPHVALARAYTRLNRRTLGRKETEIVERLQAQKSSPKH